MGDIKEIFDVWITRIRSPLFGYFSLSFFATNWKAIFFLLFADSDVLTRLEFFETNTCMTSLLWIPLGISVVAALGYPWIQYALIYATSAPINRQNEINARAESDLLMVKIDLENKRSELARQKEQQVIEKAKIDEELENISDEEARERAKEEIQAIRSTENNLRDPINEESLEKYLLARFPDLPVDKRITRIFLKDVNLDKYNSIEDVEKIMNESKDFIEFYKSKNPTVFKSSIDYVTKSFGFSDTEFRKKHAFSKETVKAMDNFSRA